LERGPAEGVRRTAGAEGVRRTAGAEGVRRTAGAEGVRRTAGATASGRRCFGQMLYLVCARMSTAIPADPGGRHGDSWRSTIALDKRSAKSFIRINDRIRAREIRVIDENGEQMGILPPFEALRIARERGLDLVEVSPNAVPPVCRIQDYGRFLYEKEKSERAAKKKQKIIVVKEVKFSVTVDEHDYQTKKNQAVRFLVDGDKVKASLRFRGRQMAHRELGYAIINKLIQDIGEAGVVEFMPRMEGTILHAIIAPSKKQEAPKPKAPEAPRPPAPPRPVAQAPAPVATPVAAPAAPAAVTPAVEPAQ